MRVLLYVLVFGISAGCARARTPDLSPAASTATSDWPIALTAAIRSADSANYTGAERTLVDFGSKHPNSLESRESLFWRALYRLDPANRSGSLQDGIAMLDRYLADSAGLQYRSEAVVVRRIAVAAHNSRLAQGTVNPGSAARDTVLRSRDDEVATLREQLAKANAELERIKRRLANPRG